MLQLVAIRATNHDNFEMYAAGVHAYLCARASSVVGYSRTKHVRLLSLSSLFKSNDRERAM